MAFVGGIGTGFIDLGGEVHTTYLDALDFKQAEVNLLQLAGYLEHVENPLLLARRIAVEDMKERFDNQTDPEGHRWVELTDTYSERKQREVGFVDPILTRSTELRDSATQASNWTVSADSVFFSTSNLPEYWRAHQLGSGDFDVVQSEAFKPGVGKVKINEFNAYRNDDGKGVPARPFIGISADAEDKILDIFDLWFSKGVEEATKSFAVSSQGVLQTRIKGRFGPKPIIG